MKRGKAILAALCLLLGMGLGGCKDRAAAPGLHGEEARMYGGEKNLTEEGDGFALNYAVKILELEQAGLFLFFSAAENGFYARDVDNRVFQFDTEGKTVKKLYDGGEGLPCMSPSGDRWLFKRSDTKDRRGIEYSVRHLEDEGEKELLSWVSGSGADLAVSDRYLYIAEKDWENESFPLKVYDREGRLISAIELGEYAKVRTADSGVYIEKGGSISRLNEESLELEAGIMIGEDKQLLGISGGFAFLTDETFAYRQDLNGGTAEPLFRWSALHLETSGVSAQNTVPIMGGRMFFVYDLKNEASPYKLIYLTDSAPAEKRRIVMAVNNPVDSLDRGAYGSYHDALLDFNICDQSYELVVKNYAECADPQTALNTDIAAGEVPDIIDMAGFSDSMINAKNCMDLLPMLKKTEAELLQGPLEAMLREGKLLSLIPSFSVCAVLGPAELMEGKNIESYGELAALAGGAEHVFGQGLSREDFLRCVFACDHRAYTAEQVEDILLMAAALPEFSARDTQGLSGEEIAEGFDFGVDRSGILSGEQRFELARIAGPVGTAFASRQDLVGFIGAHTYFGEPLAAVGLPVADGCRFLLAPVQELVIPVGAENPEGAWAFMEFMLADRYLVNLLYGGSYRQGIPITVSAYEKGFESAERWLEKGGKISRTVGAREVGYTMESMEELEEFRRMVDQVSGICRDEDEICRTVLSLAQGYFAGDRELEQTAADIVSRLSVYLAENE